MKNLKGWFQSVTYISVLTLFVLSTGCVTTQKDLDPIQTDLQTLRQQLVKTQEEVTAMHQNLGKETEKQLSGFKSDLETIQKNQADSKVQLEQLNRDVSIVNNRLDDYQEKMNKLEQRIATSEQSMTQKLDLAKAEIQKKLDAIQQSNPTGVVPLPTTSDTTGTPPSPTEIVDPQQLYQTLDQDYNKGHYDLSVNEAKDYIRRFPNGAQVASVRFLLAQSYLALQKYDEALTEFNGFVTGYPSNDKVPAAMLKRAYIYKQQKKSGEQQQELKDLVKKYPLSPEAEQALEELKSVNP